MGPITLASYLHFQVGARNIINQTNLINPHKMLITLCYSKKFFAYVMRIRLKSLYFDQKIVTMLKGTPNDLGYIF